MNENSSDSSVARDTSTTSEDSSTDTQCSFEGCTASHPNHKWGNIKAEGWFHQKDDTAYCPEHVPEWVKGWRKKNA